MSDTPPRFTLQVGQWYAAEIIGDEFREADLRSYSPIRIDSVITLGKQDRTLELSFYHLNYPEGVRSKVYKLQTLERGLNYLLARRVGAEPHRILLIYHITWEWMQANFRTFAPSPEANIQTWLNRTYSP